MPTIPRPGKQTLYAELPPEIYRRLKERAERCRRTLTGELILALEWYLETPPVPAPPPPPEQPKRPRGRPRKREK
jgi:hypothetical protein